MPQRLDNITMAGTGLPAWLEFLNKADSLVIRRADHQVGVITRTARIDQRDVDPTNRSFKVSFSSQTDDVRFAGTPEVLLHEEGAVDLAQLESIGSVLFNHDPNRIVGKPADVHIDSAGRKGRATIIFDSDPESEAIYQKVIGGSLRGISVGFRVNQWQTVEQGDSWTSPRGQSFAGPAYVATSWKPIEFSLTPIPADGTVGVNRSGQGNTEPELFEKESAMTKTAKAALTKRGLKSDATDEEAEAFLLRLAEEPTEPPKPDGGASAPDPVVAEKRAAKVERERIASIRGICDLHEQTKDLAWDLIDQGSTTEQARAACLDVLAKLAPKLDTARRVEFVEDSRDKFRSAVEDWVLLRTNSLRDEKRAAIARDIPCFSLIDVARECLRRGGLPAGGMDRNDIATRALSHTSSDFPLILANTANKYLQQAWAEAPSTWRPLAKTISASDFKALTFPKLGDAGDLALTRDLEPMPETSFSEKTGTVQIATYSKRFGIGRQAIINDDLGALTEIPRLMGQAAARVPQKLFWDLLISATGTGPVMSEDSLHLFATTHTSGLNYNTGAFAISIANLGTAKMYMRLQRGLAATGETAPILNIVPRYLVVPAALETLALQMVTQITPAIAASVTPSWVSQLTVIVEPRLDAGTAGTTNWYLAADPAQIPGFVLSFLNGSETPTAVRVEGTNMLGVEMGVYLDCGVAVLDHRGWWRSAGA